jgi:hypothetical protein
MSAHEPAAALGQASAFQVASSPHDAHLNAGIPLATFVSVIGARHRGHRDRVPSVPDHANMGSLSSRMAFRITFIKDMRAASRSN